MKESRLRPEIHEIPHDQNTPYFWKDLNYNRKFLPMPMLCGCVVDENSRYDEDSEGFIVCHDHKQRRMGWRVPLYRPVESQVDIAGLSDIQFQNLTVFGERPVPVRTNISTSVPDLRPYIYEGMLDEKALQAIARARNTVEPAVSFDGSHRTLEIPPEQYCDLATDSSHSSANGLG